MRVDNAVSSFLFSVCIFLVFKRVVFDKIRNADTVMSFGFRL
jgi:hypothetical protein